MPAIAKGVTVTLSVCLSVYRTSVALVHPAKGVRRNDISQGYPWPQNIALETESPVKYEKGKEPQS